MVLLGLVESIAMRLIFKKPGHGEDIANGLISLLENKILVDVHIKCGNQIISAHKVILAANSLYFKVSHFGTSIVNFNFIIFLGTF